MLVYCVDVRSLSEKNTESVLALVNTCFEARISRLDYSYGVICQDRGDVLGVALVSVQQNEHEIQRLCVDRSRRGAGLGTEILSVVKEQLNSLPAAMTLPSACARREDVRVFFQTNGFVNLPGDRMRFSP